MASKTSIINQALILLGESPISNFDAPVGIIANSVYETTKDTMLSDHRWRFAVKKAALTAASGSPVNEWTNHYTLPTDMILLIRTYPNSNYEVFENKLATNASSVSVDYVFDPGENKYPEYFVKAMAAQLASDMALAVTNDKTLEQRMAQKAVQFVASARHKDSQGRPSSAIQRRPYIDIRG